MHGYLVRVELHDASGADYDVLHDAMSKQGFRRTITSDGGIEYTLPTAEYYAMSYGDCDRVREYAKTAAATTGKDYWVLVAQTDRLSWHLMKA